MNRYSKLFLGIMLIFSIILFSCKPKKRFEVEKSELRKTESALHIVRFDSAIIHLDRENPAAALKTLAAKYPEIYQNYFENMLEIDANDFDFAAEMMLDLLSDTTYAKINEAVAQRFASIAPIEKRLASVYTYFHQYFPDIELPALYFFVSGCNRSILTHRGYIGIGLDWYLGADYYDFYSRLTYEYLAQNMNPQSIPIDVTLTLLKGGFPFKSRQNRLIDNMLYQGKLLYMLSVMLPDEPAENIAGYTSEQLAWCRRYQRDIWGAMIEKKHLFSTEFRLIREYTGDAPFSAPLSQDSPGRVANWVGWQIVRSYMNSNPDVALQALAADNDFGKILEKSKYKP